MKTFSFLTEQETQENGAYHGDFVNKPFKNLYENGGMWILTYFYCFLTTPDNFFFTEQTGRGNPWKPELFSKYNTKVGADKVFFFHGGG